MMRKSLAVLFVGVVAEKRMSCSIPPSLVGASSPAMESFQQVDLELLSVADEHAL